MKAPRRKDSVQRHAADARFALPGGARITGARSFWAGPVPFAEANVSVPSWRTGRFLKAVTSESVSRRRSYVLVSRNANEADMSGHHCGPHASHPSAAGFVQSAADPFVLLANDLPDLYRWHAEREEEDR